MSYARNAPRSFFPSRGSLRTRFMDPTVGRFISADPWEGDIARPLTLAKYPYAENDPVDKVDPTGNAAAFGVLSRAEALVGQVQLYSVLRFVGTGLSLLGGAYSFTKLAVDNFFPPNTESLSPTQDTYVQSIVRMLQFAALEKRDPKLVSVVNALQDTPFRHFTVPFEGNEFSSYVKPRQAGLSPQIILSHDFFTRYASTDANDELQALKSFYARGDNAYGADVRDFTDLQVRTVVREGYRVAFADYTAGRNIAPDIFSNEAITWLIHDSKVYSLWRAKVDEVKNSLAPASNALFPNYWPLVDGVE